MTEPVCTLDYLPTLSAILGYKMPDARPIDGTNTLLLLQGDAWSRDKFIPFASNMQKQSPTASVIDQGHKLLLWFDSKKEVELYALQEDRAEERNLIDENPVLAKALQTKLMTWLNSARQSYETGDYPGYKKQGQFIRTGTQ